jgi:hypothetical protein
VDDRLTGTDDDATEGATPSNGAVCDSARFRRLAAEVGERVLTTADLQGLLLAPAAGGTAPRALVTGR